MDPTTRTAPAPPAPRPLDGRDLIDQLQHEAALERRRRINQLLMVAMCCSLIAHLAIMIYLNSVRRTPPTRVTAEPIMLEFAALTEEELTSVEALVYDDLSPEVTPDLLEVPEDTAIGLSVEGPEVEMNVTGPGTLSTLGGSGESGGGDALGGGAAKTSFFGISSRGTRFAYVVDVSGSMQQGRKIQTLMTELERSIMQLPDYAYVYVVLYSTNARVPPDQTDWMRTRPNAVATLIRWLRSQSSGGGTLPVPGFVQVFSLETPPDVIFFMTDGEIPENTGQEIAAMNRRGGRVVINTIAFGDPSSQAQLKTIAQQSGGTYRFVSAGGP